MVLADDELMPMRLHETVYALLDDPDRLAEMRDASESIARPAAARAVAAQVLAAAGGPAGMSDAPWAGRRLHFMGVGGPGMSGLAIVARAAGREGHRVRPCRVVLSGARCASRASSR